MKQYISFLILFLFLISTAFAEQVPVGSFNKIYLEKKLQEIVVAQFHDVPHLDVHVSIKNTNIFKVFPNQAAFVFIDLSKPDSFLGKLLLDVTFLSENNEVLAENKCFVHIKAFGKAYASAHKIQPSKILDEADLVLKTVELDSRYSNFIFDTHKLLGKQTKRSMSKGVLFSHKWVEIVPNVKKGDAVQVLVSSSGYEIRYKAEALESGMIGDLIRLKTFTKKILRGEVLDESTVFVRTY